MSERRPVPWAWVVAALLLTFASSTALTFGASLPVFLVLFVPAVACFVVATVRL